MLDCTCVSALRTEADSSSVDAMDRSSVLVLGASHASNRDSHKVLDNASKTGSHKGSCKVSYCGFYSEKVFSEGFWEGVLRTEVCQKVLRTPCWRVQPLRPVHDHLV